MASLHFSLALCYAVALAIGLVIANLPPEEKHPATAILILISAPLAFVTNSGFWYPTAAIFSAICVTKLGIYAISFMVYTLVIETALALVVFLSSCIDIGNLIPIIFELASCVSVGFMLFPTFSPNSMAIQDEMQVIGLATIIGITVVAIRNIILLTKDCTPENDTSIV